MSTKFTSRRMDPALNHVAQYLSIDLDPKQAEKDFSLCLLLGKEMLHGINLYHTMYFLGL